MSLKVVHKKYLGIDISKEQKYSNIEQIAQSRLKIITHFNTYGLASTLDAFCVSKRSLYRWRKKLIESNGNWKSLIPTSTSPKKRNSRYVDYRILKFIQLERMKQVVGHKKLYHMLIPHCKKWGISLPSITTLSRVVKTMKENKQILSFHSVIYYAKTGKIKRISKPKNKKERRGEYEPTSPGDVCQIDTVELRVKGKKIYAINIIDLHTRLVYSRIYAKLNSKHAQETIEQAEKQFRFKIKHIQTDNGLEFHKYFDEYTTAQEIKHFWNYPRSPKMNATIERFNRTIQEEFLYRIRIILHSNIQYAQDVLLPQYLRYYNKERLHQSLDYKTPYQYYLNYQSSLCHKG
jgi:transposase InsO family protein